MRPSSYTGGSPSIIMVLQSESIRRKAVAICRIADAKYRQWDSSRIKEKTLHLVRRFTSAMPGLLLDPDEERVGIVCATVLQLRRMLERVQWNNTIVI